VVVGVFFHYIYWSGSC